jgi:sulfoxide reductase heme-binding subunit YedZ
LQKRGSGPQSIRRERFWRRIRVHHLPIGAATIAAALLLYATRPYKDTLTKLSFATAYPALVLTAATLLIGPWNALRRKTTPVSSDLRRDVGIWAGILAVVHTVIGQNVHLRGRPWLYYIYGPKEAHTFPLRHDRFGFANYTGLGSALLLLALVATSNDYALRALGTPRWKQLQRWNYVAFALAGAHALGYQTNEKQHASFVTVVVLSIAITAILQALGFRSRRAAARNCSPRVAVQPLQ